MDPGELGGERVDDVWVERGEEEEDVGVERVWMCGWCEEGILLDERLRVGGEVTC